MLAVSPSPDSRDVLNLTEFLFRDRMPRRKKTGPFRRSRFFASPRRCSHVSGCRAARLFHGAPGAWLAAAPSRHRIRRVAVGLGEYSLDDAGLGKGVPADWRGS